MGKADIQSLFNQFSCVSIPIKIWRQEMQLPVVSVNEWAFNFQDTQLLTQYGHH